MKNCEESLWSAILEKSKNAEVAMGALERKRTGSYYTDLALTDIMIEELVQRIIDDGREIWNCRFLEPCVGAGNFVFSYLKYVNELNLSNDKIEILLNNIYVADINTNALNTYRQSFRTLVYYYWKIELSDEYFNEHIGSGLLIDVTAQKLEYIKLSDAFGNLIDERFDIVVTNPPYKNLKAERGHYSNNNDYELDKEKYSAISDIVSNRYKYSTDGVLNLYKLFVEEIIDSYANDDAYVSLLIPSTILSDKSCSKLRTHILKDNSLLSVKNIGEGSGYIDAQQALSAIFLKKGSKTEKINIVKDFCREPNQSADVFIDDILNKETGNAIFAVSESEYDTLKKLRQFPTVKNLNFIINLRGELDLTANKKYISKEKTMYPLIRGRDIGYYTLNDSSDKEYVSEEFVKATKKSCYIYEKRIICQQIANMHKNRRVTFALADSGCVLGNSCNFITVSDNDYGIDIYSLLGLFNTKIINWLFKLTSSNNHVNNYEIDSFPVPITAPEMRIISDLTRRYIATYDESILNEIERLAERAYGLKEPEGEHEMNKKYLSEYMSDIQKILPSLTYEDGKKLLNEEIPISHYYSSDNKFINNVAKGITEKYICMKNGRVINHQTFKLSALDLEMIKPVPQGGSWKDIPAETVEKSKRLKRLTSTGGRTTLYGRIDYNKPSYTITTYFNRPGNGTYVHPIHERVLSVREAARFQTFRDDYFFFGNKTQLLKQVGNAVPTLLAFQIAKSIKVKTGCSKSIDLFCGAGGMTSGFKAAGITSLLSNDIEESACITLKINNPEINVLCGDITKPETKDTIERAAKEGGADIICGGPPCQGFSMAGFRSDKDPRNELFREFVDIVRRVNPKVIVFENVEGLLSFQGGKTYNEVHSLFSELGYNTEGRTLTASDYGVPQKRKRVIIICTRQDLNISPSVLFPVPITLSDASKITAKETIYDLEKVECGEAARYDETSTYSSEILKFFKREISYDEYVDSVSRISFDSAEPSQITFWELSDINAVNS